jgi:hypothetical protein
LPSPKQERPSTCATEIVVKALFFTASGVIPLLPCPEMEREDQNCRLQNKRGPPPVPLKSLSKALFFTASGVIPLLLYPEKEREAERARKERTSNPEKE